MSNEFLVESYDKDNKKITEMKWNYIASVFDYIKTLSSDTWYITISQITEKHCVVFVSQNIHKIISTTDVVMTSILEKNEDGTWEAPHTRRNTGCKL